MELSFVSLKLPTDDSEYVDVRFAIPKGLVTEPPFFMGNLQASIPLEEALSAPLNESIAKAKAIIVERLAASR